MGGCFSPSSQGSLKKKKRDGERNRKRGGSERKNKRISSDENSNHVYNVLVISMKYL